MTSLELYRLEIFLALFSNVYFLLDFRKPALAFAALMGLVCVYHHFGVTPVIYIIGTPVVLIALAYVISELFFTRRPRIISGQIKMLREDLKVAELVKQYQLEFSPNHRLHLRKLLAFWLRRDRKYGIRKELNETLDF